MTSQSDDRQPHQDLTEGSEELKREPARNTGSYRPVQKRASTKKFAHKAQKHHVQGATFITKNFTMTSAKHALIRRHTQLQMELYSLSRTQKQLTGGASRHCDHTLIETKGLFYILC